MKSSKRSLKICLNRFSAPLLSNSQILGRGAYDAGEDLVPHTVGPAADGAVPRQPLLLRGVDDETEVPVGRAAVANQRVDDEAAAGESA